MIAFALAAQLSSAALATEKGLQLRIVVQPGPVRSARELLHIEAELSNVSNRPIRIVFQPAGEQPLTLMVDGKAHALPLRPSTVLPPGWVELKPGDHVTEYASEIVDLGPHTFSWRYVSTGAPYGRPLERCWTGTLDTPAVTPPHR